jgi:hypothetical protein
LVDGLMAGAALTACVVVTLTLASAANAEPNAEPDTWGPVTSLPTESSPASDQIVSSPTGSLIRYSVQSGWPSVAFFEPDGKLGSEQIVTGSSDEGVPGPVTFLPDGAAVISYERFSSAPLALTMRLPNGDYGPRYEVPSGSPGIVAFAASEGEVLLVRETTGTTNFKPEIVVSSLAIDGDELKETGSPTPVYELPAADTAVAIIRSVGVALDADGQADLVILTEAESYGADPDAHNEVLDFSRNAKGVWGGARSLSAGLPEEEHANGMQVAVAPGGRALLAFQTGRYPPINSGGADQLETHIFASLREPDGTFATPTQVSSLAGNGGVEYKARVAAGGDGTLALAVHGFSCQNFEDGSEVPDQTLNVLVAAPGKPLASDGISILDTASSFSVLTALGAGDGQALVGVQDQITTSGTDTNYCAAITIDEDPSGEVDDRGVLVGGQTPGKTFGGIPFHFGTASTLAVNAAGIDLAGDAVVTGSLATNAGAEYDYYTGPLSNSGNGESTGTTKTGGTSGGTSGSTSTPGVGAGTSGTSANTGASTTTVTASGGTVTVGGASVTLPTTASCSSTPASSCTITSTATVPAGGATKSSVKAASASAKHKHGKPVTIGKGTITLAAGAKGTLRLTLTSHGLALLRSRHTLSITVTVTVTGQGRPTATRTLHFQLKLSKRPRRK